MDHGVDWSDANLAGSLIGQKLAINEFVAYLNFALSANERHAGCHIHCHYLVRPLWLVNFGSIGVVVERFRLFRQNARRKSPSLVYGRWRRRRFPNLMSATIAGFFIGLAELIAGCTPY